MDAEPQLSLFAFHLESPALATLETQNAATQALMERVTRRGRVMLSGAQVGERYVGRVCVLGFRTRREHMQACVEDLAAESAALLAEAVTR
jgi:aromatic-L-amino-acid decarboxylase